MSEQMVNKLRDEIEKSGLSLLALSKKCGVPQPRIYEFMVGSDIRISTAQKLADYFGLVLDQPQQKKKN